ncbi:MAG: acetoacetate--CoA ligase [Acidobacteriota bacterium]|nr:acetoacetate--CoA ligase [Acidobacteriota bacterium]
MVDNPNTSGPSAGPPASEPEPVWRPSPERVAASNLVDFMACLERQGLARVGDYDALYQWSVAEPESFWPAVWDYCQVVASHRWERVLDDPAKMPGARWFDGARLSFAENLLRFDDDHPALVSWTEAGPQRRLTYRELRREVARVAVSLAALGVEPGDRVAGFLPNLPEAIIAMLAASSLGAVWSSCSPDFGIDGVLDRFGQIEPKVLFAADGYVWSGKEIDVLPRVRAVVEKLPSLVVVVMVPHLRESSDLASDLESLSLEGSSSLGGSSGGVCLYQDFLADEAALDDQNPLSFAQLPFDHPLYILYSSGTTGLPKCMVHGAGGTLLQHLKELVLHTDLRREDKIFYYTTCGWMMWNWLVSSLAVGATVLLYDGSPLPAERKAILFDLAQEEGMTVFGTSAKFLALAEKEGLKPSETHDLGPLRTILSTGSPLAPESYDYVYREVAPDVCLASISGGTDLVSCFALGNPTGPVYRGELQVRGLGMAVQVFDPDGEPLVGEKGELVCTQAFPSMPVAFWNDPDGERYRSAYFDFYPGIWRHGDWVELTPRGGLIIYGRSDATLNPGGVRIGTAEIYRQVEALDEVLESLVVGQRWQGDVRIVLFVRLRPGHELDDELRERIRRHIRANATPRHVPAKILAVADIPRTISGKISELAVRNVIHGEPVKNTDALANPQALELFRDLPELKD